MLELENGSIGRRIRDARLKLGLTQEKLAARANLHYSYVGQVERGNKIPSLKTLAKIAKALNLRVEDLIKDGEKKSSLSSPSLLSQELLSLVRDRPEEEQRLYISLVSQVKRYLEGLKD